MKLVIFDCDGTLVDSQHLIVEAMNAGLRQAGLSPLPREKILSIVGLSLPLAVETLLPDQPVDVVAAVTLGYRDGALALRQGEAARDPLYEGIAAVVDELAGRDDVLLGIATGKSIRGVDRMLGHTNWADRFVTIQTADTNPSKPHPAMIETAMREAGTDPHRTLMIGDTTFDLRMAKNAGVASLAVTWGYHPVADLMREGADAIADRTADLIPHIDNLLAAG